MALFPQRIPVVVLSGEFGTGKTMATLTTGAPLDRVLLYDFELGAATYFDQAQARGTPFVRRDLIAEVMQEGDGKYTEKELYLKWARDIGDIEPGQYDVVAIDTVEKLEKGVADYVRANPLPGKTSNQYASASGLFWGDVKDTWERALLHLTSKVQMVILTAHMRYVYKGNRPTDTRERKGKETLSLLATLELELIKKEGQVLPDARVLKSRLVHADFEGDADPRPVFGTYIQKFSWRKVREALEQPTELEQEPDLTEEEKAERQREHEALLARAAIAQAEASRVAAELGLDQVQQPAASHSNGKCPVCFATAGHAPWCVEDGQGGRKDSRKG